MTIFSRSFRWEIRAVVYGAAGLVVGFAAGRVW